MTLHQTMFYAACVMLVICCLLGLAGIWFEDFWSNDISAKLVATSLILFATTLAGAAITKWLM